jgi:hypothetical protein
MKPHHRRHLRATALGVLACTALAAPAAADTTGAGTVQPSITKVGDTPADYPGASRAPVAPAPKAGDTPVDDPGMPGSAVRGVAAQVAPARGHATAAASGFDWPSAAIGAAGAGLLIVLSLGGVSVASHRTRLAP